MLSERGYPMVYRPNHPRARARGFVFEHILVAEKALGKPLPEKAVVHHVNEKTDNRNLVICEDQAYHLLIHRRLKALEACGDPSKVQCWYCKEWDDPDGMAKRTTKNQFHHKPCAAKWQRERRRRVNDRPAT